MVDAIYGRSSVGKTVVSMWMTRSPSAELQPFVETVWASDAEGERGREDVVLERMLPACTSHLVLRLGGQPIEIFGPDTASSDGTSTDRTGQRLGYAVVAGPRSRHYVRRPALEGRTIGAVLKPGAAQVLLGAHGSELVDHHSRLVDLWGKAADELHERVAGRTGLGCQLQLFERLLAQRVQRPLALHPAIAQAMSRFATATTVRAVVEDAGYSHRRFNELFTQAVGMPPKLYSRVSRFERVIRLWEQVPTIPLCNLALRGGYSDQAHLSREFRQFAGITLGEYRAAGRPGSRHVPIPSKKS